MAGQGPVGTEEPRGWSPARRQVDKEETTVPAWAKGMDLQRGSTGTSSGYFVKLRFPAAGLCLRPFYRESFSTIPESSPGVLLPRGFR